MAEGMTVADRFRILGSIGTGGMGAVYRATDLTTGTEVALKLLTKYAPTDVERFMREISTLEELSHPGIVRYIAHGLANKQPYYAMEWIQGSTLADRIDHVGLTTAESVTVVRMVAEALAYTHARGVVHRDLKPTNVVLDGDDVAKPRLIDFGIARRARDSHLTVKGGSVGTPGYMAPEQVRGERDLDARVDVFTLGCMLHECLSGAPTFDGKDWLATQTRILIAPTPVIRGLDPDLAKVLARMLAKAPADRYADAGGVVEALDALPPMPESPRQRVSQRSDGSTLMRPAPRPPAEKAIVERGALVLAVVENPPADLDALVRVFGGNATRIEDGAVVVRIDPEGDGSVYTRAAWCALMLHDLGPAWPISIVGDLGALDGATQELQADQLRIVFHGGANEIRLQPDIAKELEKEFEIRRDRVGLVLVPRKPPA